MFLKVVMQTIIKSPSECTEIKISTFEKLTEDGGQVVSYILREKIERTQKLVFIWNGDVCVAIGTLKNPASSYKNKLFKAAGVSEKSSLYSFEIGYIYVTVNGVGNKLMETVLEANYDVITFATTGDSNGAKQHSFPKFGFKKLGNSYNNESGEYLLGLFGNES